MEPPQVATSSVKADAAKVETSTRSPVKDGDAKSSGKSETLSQTIMKSGSRFKTEEEIQRATMEAFLKDQAALRPFKHPIERCMSWEAMRAKKDDVFVVDNLMDFHSFQDDFEDSVECANDIMGSVTQTTGDIVKHYIGKVKALARKKIAEEDLKQKELLKKVREDAAEAARKIREKAGAKAAQLPSLFTIDWHKVGGITPAVRLSQMPRLQSESWNKPFIVTAACEELALMVGNAKLQKHLLTYSRDYKRSLAKVKGKYHSGRDQKRNNSEEVDEACKDVFGALLPQLDIAEVEGGAGFMSTSFFFGYAAHPDHVWVGINPNCAAQVKVLAVGEVSVLMIDLCTLMAASTTKVGPAFETLDYMDSIKDWTEEKVTAMVAGGVTMYVTTHKQGEMLVVPQGWLVAEMSCNGHRDIYGIRKAYFSSKAKDVQEYESCIKLFEASAKDATRMKAILDVMQQ